MRFYMNCHNTWDNFNRKIKFHPFIDRVELRVEVL